MTKALRKFFADGGGAAHFTLSYYSPDVDARWSIDVDSDDSLQLIYRRKDLPATYDPDFLRSEGENWIEPGTVISDALHEQLGRLQK